MIDGQSIFDPAIRSNLVTYDNIRKIATSQRDDYNYFKNYYKMMATDFSKNQALDADPKAIQKINFTGNRDRLEDLTTFFIIEETKETLFDFSQGKVKVL